MADSIDSVKGQIDALNAAIASGARSVTLSGQTITYNNTAALIAARDDAIKRLNALTLAPRPRSHQMIYGGRGYQ